MADTRPSSHLHYRDRSDPSRCRGNLKAYLAAFQHNTTLRSRGDRHHEDIPGLLLAFLRGHLFIQTNMAISESRQCV